MPDPLPDPSLVTQSVITTLLSCDTKPEACTAIGAAEKTDLDELREHTYVDISAQRLIGNPDSTITGKPAAVDLDDGGLIITSGKIYVGDTSLNGKVLYLSADRSDGKNGTGSLASPLNASTPDRIDAIMKGLYDAKTPANLNFLPHPAIRMNGVKLQEVYPAPGHTADFAPWYFYNGLRIKGFGKGRTVFKPVANAQQRGNPARGEWAFFQSSYLNLPNHFVDQGSIEDCTFDGEVTGSASLTGPAITYRFGFRLMAGDFQLKGVHFTQLGGRGQEMFPFHLGNGATGLVPARRCKYLIEDCSSKYCHSDGRGVGMVIDGPSDTSAYQTSLWEKNQFDDAYICWAWQRNIKIHRNILRAATDGMPGNYCLINGDTGINSGIDIINNHLIGAIANGVAVGAITLGNWLSATLGVMNRDILIDGNTFEMFPNNQDLYTPGVMMVGGNYNWNISNNFYKPAIHTYHFSKRGFVSAKGTGNAAPPTTRDNGDAFSYPGQGFGAAWYDPITARTGPEQANSDGILFNNKLIDYNSDGVTPTANDGKTPLGMENKLMSALT